MTNLKQRLKPHILFKNYISTWITVFSRGNIDRFNYWAWHIINFIIAALFILATFSTCYFVLGWSIKHILKLFGTFYLIDHFGMLVPHLSSEARRMNNAGVRSWLIMLLLCGKTIPGVSFVAGGLIGLICLMPTGGSKITRESIRRIWKNKKHVH